MGQGDDGAAIESSIDGAEAQDLGFGPAGGGAIKARTGLAQGGVTLAPNLARCLVAAEEDFVFATRPFECAAEFAGNSGELLGAQAAAFREAFAPLHAGPKTAIGKAIVGFRRREMLFEVALGYVGDEADMGAGSLQGLMSIEGAEMAAIPGTAKQG